MGFIRRLRFPRRALDTYKNVEPHRIDVCDGEAKNEQEQELWKPENNTGNGLQADANRRGQLA